MGYKLGKKVTDDGVWIEFSGAELKICRAGTVEFLKKQEELEKPYKKRIDKGTLPATIKRDINLKCIAETILVDWKGVEDESGKAVAYSPELGINLLMDDPDALELVMDIALDNENFAISKVPEVAKKSSKR